MHDVFQRGAAARRDRRARMAGATHRIMLLLGMTAAFAVTSANAHAGLDNIRISELRVDQPGSDIDEYVELTGPPAWSLNGITFLVIGDGGGGSGVIEERIDLDGFSFGLSGVFLMGEAGMTLGTPHLATSINFENSDNLTHLLVSGFSGAMGDDLDLDDDGILDVFPWEVLIDGVATVESVESPPVDTEWWYAEAVGPVAPGVGPFHILRCADSGDWVIGPDDVVDGFDTPGSANPPCNGLEGCGGDLDLDGDVDSDDVGILLSVWGSDHAEADLDLDGVVGAADLGWMLAVWGPCR